MSIFLSSFGKEKKNFPIAQPSLFTVNQLSFSEFHLPLQANVDSVPQVVPSAAIPQLQFLQFLDLRIFFFYNDLSDCVLYKIQMTSRSLLALKCSKSLWSKVTQNILRTLGCSVFYRPCHYLFYKFTLANLKIVFFFHLFLVPM